MGFCCVVPDELALVLRGVGAVGRAAAERERER